MQLEFNHVCTNVSHAKFLLNMAYSSKVELLFRDLLADEIISSGPHFAAREYTNKHTKLRRCDLAVIDVSGNAVEAAEFKNYYQFDLWNLVHSSYATNAKKIISISKDLNLLALAGITGHKYFIVLITAISPTPTPLFCPYTHWIPKGNKWNSSAWSKPGGLVLSPIPHLFGINHISIVTVMNTVISGIRPSCRYISSHRISHPSTNNIYIDALLYQVF